MKKWNVIWLTALFGITVLPPACMSQASSQQTSGGTQVPAKTQPDAASNPDGTRPELHTRNPRYKIQPDDILDLSFRFTPEFDQEVTVQPDGFVQLKGIRNDVYVKDQTIPEFTQTLQKAYENVLNKPVISVVLREFEKPFFIAGGQVSRPGKYDLRGTTTATQAIAISGGFADFAKNTQVLLFRRYNDDMVEVKILNLKPILNGKNVREDMVLQPGDMLYVPKTFLAKIDRFLPRSSLGTYFAPPIP